MIECRWFTNEQAIGAIGDAASPQLSEILVGAAKSAPTAHGSDPVALIAFKGDAIAGWIWFTYGIITDNGHPIRVAAAQNLYTHPEFRGCGAGKMLIQESLNIGMPCIYSGISGQAMPLYQKLGFTFLDMCPIYRLPLNLGGLIRNWRAEYYGSANLGIAGIARSLIKMRRITRHALSSRAGAWHIASIECARNAFDRISTHRARRFQVPWGRDYFLASLEGIRNNPTVVVLNNSASDLNESRLVSIYRRDAEVRVPFTTHTARFIDGHVNEIYPPIENATSAIEIICTLSREARRTGVGCLSIYGMTAAIRQACEALGLSIQGEKRFAIRSGGLNESIAAELSKGENWWCRAMNEEQIEETALDSAFGNFSRKRDPALPT